MDYNSFLLVVVTFKNNIAYIFYSEVEFFDILSNVLWWRDRSVGGYKVPHTLSLCAIETGIVL